MATGIVVRQAACWHVLGFNREQWPTSWSVVTERPGGVFIIRDRLGVLLGPLRSSVAGSLVVAVVLLLELGLQRRVDA
jgi:hypothetical protein